MRRPFRHLHLWSQLCSSSRAATGLSAPYLVVLVSEEGKQHYVQGR